MLGITLGSMPGPLSRTSTMQTKSLVVTSISIFLGGLLRLKAVMLLEIKLMKIVSRWLDSQATVKLKSPVIFKPMFSALNRGLNIWIAWFSGTVKTTAEVGEFGEQNNASSWLIKWALRSLSWCKNRPAQTGLLNRLTAIAVVGSLKQVRVWLVAVLIHEKGFDRWPLSSRCG